MSLQILAVAIVAAAAVLASGELALLACLLGALAYLGASYASAWLQGLALKAASKASLLRLAILASLLRLGAFTALFAFFAFYFQQQLSSASGAFWMLAGLLAAMAAHLYGNARRFAQAL